MTVPGDSFWMPGTVVRKPNNMQLFFLPDACPGTFALDEDESKHCTRVLRLREGDKISVTNGKGTIYHCVIASVGKKCLVEVESIEEDQKGRNKIHIAIAPTKNIDRFEWFLEKATEIGIGRITPLVCHHSEREKIKEERLHKVLVSAMKQSLSSFLPQLDPAEEFGAFVRKPHAGNKFIAFIDPGVTLELKDFKLRNDPSLLLIGPEGDFSREEVENAKSEGFIPVSLGASRLRTETAGLVACTLLNFLTD
jgi:16S rRNA (uracil1498-N3)-methyltransferase